MKIATVKIKNFRGYGINEASKDGFFHFEDLDKADFLILNGFNGFGKTSFFEAIEWCLTNSVKRLTYFEDNIDNKSSLSSNSYLIFISGTEESRTAEVKIEFDSGEIIYRKTTAKSLQDKDYNIKTFFLIDDKNLDVDTKCIKGVSLEKLFRVNFLGQETILDLIKKDKPSERNRNFLDLVDLSELNHIEENAAYRFNFKNKVEKLTGEKNKLEEAKRVADSLFAQKKWKSIDDFIKKINADKDSLKRLKDSVERESSKEWVTNTLISNEITNDNCFQFIEEASQIAERLIVKKEELIKLKKDKEIFEKAKTALSLYKKNENIEYIRKIDIKEQFKLLSDFNKTSIKNTAKANILNAIKKNTNDNKFLWQDLILVDSADIIKDYKSFVDNFEAVKDKMSVFKTIISDSDKSEFNKLLNPEYAKEIADNFDEIKTLTDRIKTNEIESIVNSYCVKNKGFTDRLKEKQDSKNKLSALNTSYTKLLEDVKLYINGNDSIDKCPVCLSTVFAKAEHDKLPDDFESKSIKDQLINIIDAQVSSGNREVKNLLDEIDAINTDVKKLKKETESKIKKLYIDVIDDINQKYNIVISTIESILKTHEYGVNESNNEIVKGRPEAEATIKRYKKLYLEIFEEQFDEQLPIKKINISVLELNNGKIEEIKSNINCDRTLVDTQDSFIKLRDSIEERLVEDSVETLSSKITELNSIKEGLERFNIYRVSKADQESIIKSSNFKKDLESIEKSILKVENDKIIVGAISKNVSIQKAKILNTLFANPLIKHIYQEINPHFRFNTIDLKNKKSGKKNLNHIQYNDIHLNQIFSSAQLNTISLSIFLGMGIPETGSKLEQLFLDDPIQSMDDLNVLALIDVFRSMVDIDNAKKIIISTHDDNFAKLLQIKMRNKNVKTINFMSYGNEGPVIDMN